MAQHQSSRVRERIASLNTWLADFRAADLSALADGRRFATRVRLNEGRAAWMEWANAMLQLRADVAVQDMPLWSFVACADFQGMRAGDAFDLSGLLFPADLVLENAEFQSDLWLNSVTVCGDLLAGNGRFHAVDLSGVSLSGRAHLDEANFSGGVEARGALFGDGVSCRGAHFERDLWARAAYRKNGDVRTVFGGDADFSGTTFQGEAGFGEAQFAGEASFQGCRFECGAGFDNVVFGGSANFDNATFCGRADFGKARFAGPAPFGNVSFNTLITDGAVFTDPLAQPTAEAVSEETKRTRVVYG